MMTFISVSMIAKKTIVLMMAMTALGVVGSPLAAMAEVTEVDQDLAELIGDEDGNFLFETEGLPVILQERIDEQISEIFNFIPRESPTD
jgi:hypothetical protein